MGMQGNVSMDNHKIIDLAAPTANSDAATKKYVDDAVKFELDGTTLKITSVTYAGGE